MDSASDSVHKRVLHFRLGTAAPSNLDYPHSARARNLDAMPAVPPPERAVRVLIADDQRLFAESLMTVLGEDDRIDVVGIAGNGREAVDLALELQPDVVLMDLNMPLLDGFEATREIRETAKRNAEREAKIREVLDTKVRTEADVEKVTDTSVDHQHRL